MHRQLSSSLTDWYKLAFPALWIAIFGIGTVALWIGPVVDRDNMPPPDWMRWMFLIMWVVGSLWLVLSSRGLCKVGIADDTLIASNFSRHITVPLISIRSVQQSYMSRPQTITIHLDCETALGRKIVFIPHGWPHMFLRHPVTDTLLGVIDRFHPTSPVTELDGTQWANNPNHTFTRTKKWLTGRCS